MTKKLALAGVMLAVAAWGQQQGQQPPQTKTVRVYGPGESPPPENGIVRAQVLDAAEPEYPKEAKRDKIHGIVMVQIEIDEKGRVTNPVVVQSVGHGLDEKAVECVKKYRFKPAMKDGKPVKDKLNIAVNFQLP